MLFVADIVFEEILWLAVNVVVEILLVVIVLSMFNAFPVISTEPEISLERINGLAEFEIICEAVSAPPVSSKLLNIGLLPVPIPKVVLTVFPPSKSQLLPSPTKNAPLGTLTLPALPAKYTGFGNAGSLNESIPEE